jgi:O-antigen/teichoic acid export membrane protein
MTIGLYRIAKSIVSYGFSNALFVGVPLILMPILARKLSVVDFGHYGIFITVVAMLGGFVGLNTGAAVTVRYCKNGHDDTSKYIHASLIVLLCSVFFSLIIVRIFKGYIIDFLKFELSWIYIAIFCAAFQYVIDIYLSIIQAKLEATKYSFFKVSQAICVFAVAILFVFQLGFGWQGVAFAYFFTTALFALFALYGLLQAKLIANKTSLFYITSALNFGIPLLPHVCGGLLLSMAPRMIVSQQLGTSQVALYVVATQISMAIVLITDSCNRVFAPTIFNRLSTFNQSDKLKIVRWTYLFFLAILSLATIVWILRDTLINLLAGNAYIDASDLIGWIAFGYAFGGCYYTVCNYIFYVEKTGWLGISTFFCGVISVVTTILLIEHYGLVGAAMAFTLSQFILFVTTWFMSSIFYRMPWIRIFSS